VKDDLPEIIENMAKLFNESLEEAKSGGGEGK